MASSKSPQPTQASRVREKDIDLMVLAYLRKKGYKASEQKLKDEVVKILLLLFISLYYYCFSCYINNYRFNRLLLVRLLTKHWRRMPPL